MKNFKNILLLAAIAATICINLTLSTFTFNNEEITTDNVTLEQLMDELSSDEQQEIVVMPEVVTEIVTEEKPTEENITLEEQIDELSNPVTTESVTEPSPALSTENDIKTDLAHFNYKSASVLPFFTSRREKYLILSREAYGRPIIGKRWKYDDFGGSRDAKDAGPLVTAAREFFEEGILNKSLHLTLDETCTFITNNTSFVVANTTERLAKHVTYIVDFKQYKNEFINNFYKARSDSTEYINKEKDMIAIVKWSDIKKAFMAQENNTDTVYVLAKVIDPKTKKGHRENIKLRTYFVIKLKNFFLDKPYQEGTNKKIHFYS